MAKRPRLIPWILGLALPACGLGAFFAAVPGEVLLICLTGLVIYGSLLAGVIGLAGFLTRGIRLQKALAAGFHGKALRMLQKWRQDERLLEVLRTRVPLPGDTVRDRLVDVVRESLALRKAAADLSNPHVPKELRKEIKRRTGDALESLWPKCQDLSLLARPGMDAPEVETKVTQLLAPLEQLADLLASTRRQLAHATFEGVSLDLGDVIENAGAMKWQATEAPKMNSMLEG
jgi:hypothetical protein